MPSGADPSKKTETVLLLPGNPRLPFQLEQVHVGLVQRKESVERGPDASEDEAGNHDAGLRFFRQGLKGKVRSFAMVIAHLRDPSLQIGKRLSVRRIYRVYGKVLDACEGREKTRQRAEIGGGKIGTEIRRNMRKDVVAGDQKALVRQVKREVTAAVPRRGDGGCPPVSDGEPIAVGKKSFSIKRG